MLKEAIATGKTIDEAVNEAKKILGVSPDDVNVEIEVLEQPKRVFFRNTPAKVRVFFQKTKADIAQDILKDILQKMGVNWDVPMTVVEDESSATIKMDGDRLGFIIGYRGETLDSLQYLIGLMTNQIDGEYYRITLDCGDYRNNREKTLEKLAEKLSKKVARSGFSTKLEPMNPYERRIIHSVVQNQKDVTSESIGEEPYRSVVIKCTNPEAAKRYRKNKNNKRPYNKNNRNGKKPYQNRNNQGGKKPYQGSKPYQNKNNKNNKNQGQQRRPYNNNRVAPKKTEDIKPKTNQKPQTTSEKVIGDLYGKIEL